MTKIKLPRIIDDETARLCKENAINIAKTAKENDIFALVGDLGSGKTTWTQSFAKEIGFLGVVVSPTFSILHTYRSAESILIHMDLYRLIKEDIINPLDLEETGFFHYIGVGGICVIEWAEPVREYLPEETKWIYFD